MAPPRNTWVQITDFSDSATAPALSPDGHVIAFIHGPDTFITRGEIYVKSLPDGQPVQLTHDNLLKMAPAFSPDGSRIAYTTTDPGLPMEYLGRTGRRAGETSAKYSRSHMG